MELANFVLRVGAHPVARRSLGGRSCSAGLRAKPPDMPQFSHQLDNLL